MVVFVYICRCLYLSTKRMSNYQGDDAEYMEDVDDEMEDVEDDMDDEFRGDDLGASDSDVEEFDYSVSMIRWNMFRGKDVYDGMEAVLLAMLLYYLICSFFLPMS